MAENPVWKVYDLLRTSRLNLKYYHALALRYARLRTWSEIGVVVLAASSFMAGSVLLDVTWVFVFWSLLSVLTIIIASINAFIRFGDKQAAAEVALKKYANLSRDLESLKYQIEEKERFGKEEEDAFLGILIRIDQAASESIVLPHDRSLIKELQEGINKEMPPSSFYIPTQNKGSGNG